MDDNLPCEINTKVMPNNLLMHSTYNIRLGRQCYRRTPYFYGCAAHARSTQNITDKCSPSGPAQFGAADTCRGWQLVIELQVKVGFAQLACVGFRPGRQYLWRAFPAFLVLFTVFLSGGFEYDDCFCMNVTGTDPIDLRT